MQTSIRLVSLALGAFSAAALGLGGCRRSDATGLNDHHGRYAGVGIYAPSVAWTKMLQDQAPGAPQAAKLADDEAIIVVTDSQTGELRACGDLSGYCVDMNPWQAGLAKAQAAPVNLNRQEGTAAAANASTATASSVVR
jgi:hypothetical protein